MHLGSSILSRTPAPWGEKGASHVEKTSSHLLTYLKFKKKYHLRSVQFIKNMADAGVLGNEKSVLANTMHIKVVNKGRCEPSAGVGAGGESNAAAFWQPDDDCGSDPSKCAHPQGNGCAQGLKGHFSHHGHRCISA